MAEGHGLFFWVTTVLARMRWRKTHFPLGGLRLKQTARTPTGRAPSSNLLVRTIGVQRFDLVSSGLARGSAASNRTRLCPLQGKDLSFANR